MQQSGRTSRVQGRGQHPHSRANLRPWPRGVSGNPYERPKDRTARELVRDILSEHPSDLDRTTQLFYEMLARRLYELAIGGNVRAMKLLFDRIDPAPRCACCVRAFYEDDGEVGESVMA